MTNQQFTFDAWLLAVVLAIIVATAVLLIPKPEGCYRPDLDAYRPCQVAP